LGILLICSAANANIMQWEQFGVGMGNGVNLFIGTQQLNSNNFLTIQNNQQENNTLGSAGTQNQIGFFNQNAAGAGVTALIGSDQGLVVCAGQGNIVVDGVGLKGQTQGSGINATNLVARAAGAGWGTGDQTYLVQQGQMGANHLGQGIENSTAFGQQTASVNGVAGSQGAAGSSTTVAVQQVQGNMDPYIVVMP
jgi:hypothetical protein